MLSGCSFGPKAARAGHFDWEPADLIVERSGFRVDGHATSAVTVNGSVPGPTLRFREGDDVVMRVQNRLDVDTSIHWHGLILPPEMDGVPGVSFRGIAPRETFTYRIPMRQSGTYWYHSHSGFQEQVGMFGALIIDPAEPEPFTSDVEHVVMLSDWTFDDPMRVLSRLKKSSGYYNFQKPTVAENGWAALFAMRMKWGAMRMDPTDIADVTGAAYTYLMNGQGPESNWTGLFAPGQTVRLRLVNAGAATYFDVRIPGLSMTVVQVDGQNVEPVAVDEIRVAIAETYDVLVSPSADRAYTIFAEAMDRSGHARGTLAPRPGMTAAVPERRPRPMLTMADMGMVDMVDMVDMGDMGGMGDVGDMGDMGDMGDVGDVGGMGDVGDMGDMGGMGDVAGMGDVGDMGGMGDVAGMAGAASMESAGDAHGEPAGPRDDMDSSTPDWARSVPHDSDDHGMGNTRIPMATKGRLDEPGLGLEQSGRRVLLYTDLRCLAPFEDQRAPEREIEMHLTGNMERYIWGFDGKKFSEASEPIAFHLGERLRITFVNDTMMNHPIHLHGMWMELVNGAGNHKPRKHTLNVKPAERLSVDISVDAPGRWAMHCHILYHMDAGMFRVVEVSGPSGQATHPPAETLG